MKERRESPPPSQSLSSPSPVLQEGSQEKQVFLCLPDMPQGLQETEEGQLLASQVCGGRESLSPGAPQACHCHKQPCQPSQRLCVRAGRWKGFRKRLLSLTCHIDEVVVGWASVGHREHPCHACTWQAPVPPAAIPSPFPVPSGESRPHSPTPG